MPRTVRGPDGVTHQFPDDATDAEIAAALEGSSPALAAPAPKSSASLVQRGAALLPTIGGVVGSLAGGTPGAILGGAAGAGYESLIRHAGELPGAVADVARNLVQQPAATLEGFRQGAQEGAEQAGIQGGIQGLANVAGNVVGWGASKLAPALMQSAVKPGLKSSLAAVRRGSELPVVKTLLDEGVNVSPGGIEKLTKIITASNDEVQAALKALPSTAQIDPALVASRTVDTAAKFVNQANPTADLAAIQGVRDEFLAAHAGQMLDPAQAQAIKSGTYRTLKSKAYGELKGAAIEAQKAIARGLKEDVAAEAAKGGVDITSPLAREGGAIEAREAVARRIALAGNRDPAGLAWLAHNPTTGLLFLMERSPAVKSAVALGLYKSAAVAARTTPEVIRTLVGAIAASNADATMPDETTQVGPFTVRPK